MDWQRTVGRTRTPGGDQSRQGFSLAVVQPAVLSTEQDDVELSDDNYGM